MPKKNKQQTVEFDLGFNFNELDLGLDQFCFDSDLDLSLFDSSLEEDEHKNRYMRAKLDVFRKKNIRYERAEELAKDLTIGKNERMNVVVSGNFIFGDFIEAWIVENDMQVEECYISTLSMNENNVESLKALLKNDWIMDLHLFISAYFYGHEQYHLMPLIMNGLDIDNKFQISVSAIHVKVAMLKMVDGRHIVIHGSANLRSSACIEQFCIEEDEELYAFYKEIFDLTEERYKTINKPLRRMTAWQGMEKKIKKEA